MKKCIKIVAVITILIIGLFALTGCGTNKNGNSESGAGTEENVKPIDDNKSYYVSINGNKFYAGDLITDLSKSNYTLKSTEETQKVPANKYMIGAGNMMNSDDKNIFDVVPYNSTSDSITISECVIGGFSISYLDAKKDSNAANIEVYGGIKIGSTEEEVKNVFGEPTTISEGTGYKSYCYESSEVYRSYTIKFDEDGKVSNIEWKNLVFNK